MSELPPVPAASAVDPQLGFSRLHPLTALVRGWALLVAGAIAVGREILGGHPDVRGLALTGGAVMAFGVAAGALSWWSTRFRIDPDELRVESGVLVRRSRRIPLERLQAVDVVQPLAGRLLGLAEVRLEVAGGSGSQARLAYLPLPEAHRLRRVLLSASAAASCAPLPADAANAASASRVLVAVPARLLLCGLLLSSPFVLAVLGFAAVTAALALVNQSPGPAFYGAEITAIGALVAKTFLAEYGFTLSEAPGGLRIRRGLLDLRSSSVLPGRVQGVALLEPALWRLLRWVRVEIDIAGRADRGNDSSGESVATLLPISSRPVADAVVARVLPGVAVPRITLTPAPPRARWLQPLGWRFLAAGADERAVVTRSGWLVRRTDVVPHAKVQSVRIRQGPLQRRLSLADVLIDSPPGPVNAKARHRYEHLARAAAFAELEQAQLARQRSRRPEPSV